MVTKQFLIARPDPMGNSTFDPVKLSNWTEFHQYVDNLPDEERILFDLLWYEGLTLHEAAESIGMSERTLRRRWQLARVQLYRQLMDDGSDD